MVSESPPVLTRIRSAWGSFARWSQARGLLYWRRARVVGYEVTSRDAHEPEAPFEVTEASRQDLLRLAAMMHVDGTEWQDRIARGNVCLVARSGPSLLGHLWISRSSELMREVGRTLDVTRDPHGAYLYDGYVLPEHRRRGVLRTLLGCSKRWAQERGILRLYAAFARDNHASGRALAQAGFTAVVGDVGILRVLTLEWKWVRFPEGLPLVDVLTAGTAPRPAVPPT